MSAFSEIHMKRRHPYSIRREPLGKGKKNEEEKKKSLLDLFCL